MKAIYTVGPFRADTPWGVEQNIRRAEGVAIWIAKAGGLPVCPHTMFRFFDKSMPDDFWLRATLSLMARCDAIYMLDGWENSEGSIAEFNAAPSLGVVRLEHWQDLTEYLK